MMAVRAWWSVALPLFLAGTVATSFAKEALECRWAETPPVLDGRSDDAVWQKAVVIDNFRQPWAEGAPAAKARTSARLLWDREWLYFFAEMEDSDVVAEVREHDGPMWENDVFEIFLRPSLEHAGYYEFEVNPAAAVLDAFFPKAESWRDPKQLHRDKFHLEAKVTVQGTLNSGGDRDRGWTVEGRIPWTDFLPTGGRPAPNETWRVNLARGNDKGDVAELSCTAPVTKLSFHRTEEYPPLRFVGPEPLPRDQWANTRLQVSPDGPAKYVARRAWPKLKAGSLVAIAPAPDAEWVWFIEQEPGWERPMKLRRLRADGDGSDAETLLALDDYAYSIAFHPRFAENGHFFLGVNGPVKTPPLPRTSRVLRYTARDGRPDPASRATIIEWPSDGHNGAALAFGGDGTLFVSSGDGTSDSDVDRVGQDPRSLRAKILRIDVDRPADGKRYSIPKDNPFIADPRFAPETWAYGLRNPWRLTYDLLSDQLWSGENGQDLWEYARLVQRGANYGWSAFEGSHPFAKDRTLGPHPITFPTLEFSHAEFRSLSGGVVYRGKAFPELTGAYVFGDFGTGRVWAARHNGTSLEWSRELLDTPLAITHVSADATGELLITDYGSPVYGAGVIGGIYRVERAPVLNSPAPEFPRLLSEAGLFVDTAGLVPQPGVLPYDINVPGWHDGATSEHHLALPADEVVEVRPTKSWQAPDGAVLAQTLSRGGRRIETRVLVKQPNDCASYTYVWNAEQTDAVLAEKGGADLELADGQPWRVPSRAECMMCHSRQANFSLTLHESQLNRGAQLSRWERLGLFRTDAAGFERDRAQKEKAPALAQQAPTQRTPAVSPLLPRTPDRLRRFFSADDPHASLEARARSYLGVNCAHCHTLYGGGNSPIEFDWLTPREEMHAIGERSAHGDFGIPDARVIAPGEPGRSVLIPRISMRGPGQMPPVGTRVVDPDGTRLLVEWIQSLSK